ncbi:MAG: radical SAM protein [Patescibacteria group bacterium]|nr:radical SAM protein [Patescibacteria group bacterium]
MTETCNLSCSHCYNSWRREPFAYTTLSRNRLLETLEQIKRNNIFEVVLTGGEPFLFKENVVEAVQCLNENSIGCSVNTNLTTMSEENAFKLKEAGVRRILTSLMSFNEETHDRMTQKKGSFQKTIRGIKNVVVAQIPLVAHMVICRANENDIYKTGSFVADLGVRAFAATKVSPAPGNLRFSEMGLSRESVKRSLETLLVLQKKLGLRTDILECYPLCLIGDAQKFRRFARRRCTAGITTAVIGANGNLRPCIHLNEVAGNIFKEGLQESWRRMDHWRNGSLIPDTCQECQHLRECTAGCRAEAQYFGNITDMDPYASLPEDVLVPPERKSITMSQSRDFLQEKLKVNPNLRIRLESFGGIASGKMGSYVFLNRDSYGLIEGLSRDEVVFSVLEISQSYNFQPEQALEFFTHLYNEEVVMKEQIR